MRLPIPQPRPCAILLSSLSILGLAFCLLPRCHAQNQPQIYTSREQAHQSLEWQQIVPHLPNPRTASAEELEQEGDILRARRFPLDALDFYHDALDRGGNVPHLLNKLGLTELELSNYLFARTYFQKAQKLDRKNSEIWNNLGAVEYIDGHISRAISDYKHAVKLNKRQPVYHANLATAYFSAKNYKSARHEMIEAIELDPNIFQQKPGLGGVAAHILSLEEKSRLAFEMARIYAREGDEEAMMRSLTEASEAGMDIQPEMRHDSVLTKYINDPRILAVVRNAQIMRSGGTGPIASGDSSPATHPL